MDQLSSSSHSSAPTFATAFARRPSFALSMFFSPSIATSPTRPSWIDSFPTSSRYCKTKWPTFALQRSRLSRRRLVSGLPFHSSHSLTRIRYLQLLLVTTLTPSNASLFPEYIFPNARPFSTDPELLPRTTYAQCIAALATQSKRFLEMTEAMKTEGTYKLANVHEFGGEPFDVNLLLLSS